jgi:hypothetical protein
MNISANFCKNVKRLQKIFPGRLGKLIHEKNLKLKLSYLWCNVHFAFASSNQEFATEKLNTLPFNRNEIKSVYEKQGYAFFLTFKMGMQLS